MSRSIQISRSAARGALAALLVMGCRAPGREGAAAAGNASGAPEAFPAADVAAKPTIPAINSVPILRIPSSATGGPCPASRPALPAT